MYGINTYIVNKFILTICENRKALILRVARMARPGLSKPLLARGKTMLRRSSLSATEPDLSIIRQRRGDHKRLGFAVQLWYLRHRGLTLATDTEPPMQVVASVARMQRSAIRGTPPAGDFPLRAVSIYSELGRST